MIAWSSAVVPFHDHWNCLKLGVCMALEVLAKVGLKAIEQ